MSKNIFHFHKSDQWIETIQLGKCSSLSVEEISAEWSFLRVRKGILNIINFPSRICTSCKFYAFFMYGVLFICGFSTSFIACPFRFFPPFSSFVWWLYVMLRVLRHVNKPKYNSSYALKHASTQTDAHTPHKHAHKHTNKRIQMHVNA